MPQHPPARDSIGWYALALSVVPFLTGLSMLLLKVRVGPRFLLYYLAQGSGVLMFGLLVIASALGLVAWARSEGRRDWRVTAAFSLQVLSLIAFLIFIRGT